MVVVGACCDRCSGKVVNELGQRIANGERWPIPTVEPIELDGVGVHLRAVPDACWEHDWFAMWRGYYAHKSYGAPPMSAVQVVIPDERGRFLWEPACEPVLAALQQMPDAPREPRARRGRKERRAARHQR